MTETTNPWVAFLTEQGAQFNDDRTLLFGDITNEAKLASESTVLVPLTHLALIQACGEDTTDFLQGQTSNDVRNINEGRHLLNSYCTPKGRMLTIFDHFMRQGDHYLQHPYSLNEAVQKRLTMFVMRSDVTLSEVSEQLPSFGFAGPQAEALLKQAVGQCPSEAGDVLTQNGITILRQQGTIPRFSCFAEPDRLIELWQQLSGDATPAGTAAWNLLEIQAGIPNIDSGSVEAFVPQMVNLQLINGVNFKKGCYPGQEVVARMQYLGKLKRRMYRASIEAAAPPSAGTALYSPSSESGQGAGKVVRAAPSANGGCEILVVAEIAIAEGQELYIENAEGAKLTLLELPYAFEQGDN